MWAHQRLWGQPLLLATLSDGLITTHCCACPGCRRCFCSQQSSWTAWPRAATCCKPWWTHETA